MSPWDSRFQTLRENPEFIAVFSEYCLALRLPCLGIGSWLLWLSLVYGLCTVGHGLFAVALGVIGRLWAVIVAVRIIFHILKAAKRTT